MSDSMQHINVVTVKVKLMMLLDDLIENGIANVPIKNNLYWSAEFGTEHDVSSDPIMGIGDLNFDVEMIDKIDGPLAWQLTYFPQILSALAQAGSRAGL